MPKQGESVTNKKKKTYVTEGSRVVSNLNTNSAWSSLTSVFEMGTGGSSIVWT